MAIECDNATLAKRLRVACKTRPANIRLPRSIRFTSDGATVRMHLAPACVKANMQDDASSFEGWALALKRWLPEISRVELAWDFDGEEGHTHYQRFLYRVRSFKSMFDWFQLGSSCDEELRRLKTNGAGDRYLLNTPKRDRATPPQSYCASLGDALSSEHKLECFIAENPEVLKALLHMNTLHRQCPVGVFRNRVKSGADYEIFPRRHSAIDLWGVDLEARKLFLFELKKPGNAPMGALSEILFYSCVMEDVQKGRFTFQEPNDEICSTAAISAYILAPEWHPLIDKELIQMVNSAFAEQGRRIGLGVIEVLEPRPSLDGHDGSPVRPIDMAGLRKWRCRTEIAAP
jgi:hypothetical protein